MNKIEDIAKYFIYISNKAGRPVSNKKLQKLLYYAQAWYLVEYGKKLYKDDIEAWVHGPTVPSIYRKYKEYGFNPIISDSITISNIKLTDDVKSFLDEIWRLYGNYDADYLELLTHQEDPWILAREGLSSENRSQQVIDTEAMKSFYTDLLSRVSNEKKKK